MIAACSSKTQTATSQPESSTTTTTATTTPVEDKTFEAGRVLPSVKVSADSSQTYALYLPSDYTPSSKMPVIIFFDPHGEGKLPVSMYNDLANQYHYILLGSNNSQNGMQPSQTGAIANNLVAEAKAQFIKGNGSPIILSGFSGGAKVALLSGAANTDVAAVIYAGAVATIQPNHSLSLLGFAGLGDLNYSDEVLYHNDLPATIEHYLIEWKGTHTWPTADAFKTAFTWPFSSIPKNELATISDRKLGELMNEDNIKHELVKNINDKDLDWWKKQIADLKKHKKEDISLERLLGFISLACYTYGKQALQQNNIPAAQKILSIYQMADPDNEDCKKMIMELNQRKIGMVK